MKIESIVLGIASIAIILIGLGILASNSYFSKINDKTKYTDKVVKINAFGNIAIGVIGILLATSYQIFTYNKKILLVAFILLIVVVNIIQFNLRKREMQ